MSAMRFGTPTVGLHGRVRQVAPEADRVLEVVIVRTVRPVGDRRHSRPATPATTSDRDVSAIRTTCASVPAHSLLRAFSTATKLRRTGRGLAVTPRQQPRAGGWRRRGSRPAVDVDERQLAERQPSGEPDHVLRGVKSRIVSVPLPVAVRTNVSGPLPPSSRSSPRRLASESLRCRRSGCRSRRCPRTSSPSSTSRPAPSGRCRRSRRRVAAVPPGDVVVAGGAGDRALAVAGVHGDADLERRRSPGR